MWFGRRRASWFLQPGQDGASGWSWLPSRPQQAATDRTLAGYLQGVQAFLWPEGSLSWAAGIPESWAYTQLVRAGPQAERNIRQASFLTAPQSLGTAEREQDASISPRIPAPLSGAALMCLCVHTRFLLKTRSGSYRSLKNLM